MTDKEYKKVYKILKSMNRLDLAVDRIKDRPIDDVINILSLKEWKDPKYSSLLTSNILRNDYISIKEILNMKEWKDPRFKGLLTSNIWANNYYDIKRILSMPEWQKPNYQRLLTPNIWRNNYNSIKKTLSMKEWEDPRFKGLLTSSVWNYSYKTISKILHLPYWEDPKYIHLLTPTIFTIPIDNIVNGIKLLEENNVEEYITTKHLRINAKILNSLIEYLKENHINLLVQKDGGPGYPGCRLHPILSCPSTQLRSKYNIEINEMGKVKKIEI